MRAFSPRFTAQLVVLLLFGSASPSLHANLFTNGDFENAPLPAGASPTNAVAVGAGTQVSGWTTTLGTGTANHNNWLAGAAQGNVAVWIPPAQSGSYSVQLDSRPGNGAFTIGNSIYQSLNLTANTSYALSFFYRSETGNSNGTLTSVGAYVGLDAQGNVPVNATGYTAIAEGFYRSPVAVDPGWNLATLNFRTGATGGLYRFTFLDGAQNATTTGYADANTAEDSNVSLDNFQLNVVPEFTHWVIFVGFGLLVISSPGWRSAWTRTRPVGFGTGTAGVAGISSSPES